MRRRFRWDKKYLYWGITAFLVIAAAVLFYMLLQHLPDLLCPADSASVVFQR